ncbi:hypothetical protein GGX14DRAFT_416902 [Mycena pura]|uniref:Uncharacterized protein n=1 Tax=Mycena pura TaxID=153505 RepID=A0AAD6YUD9_9AGAR|nr:hypothetical protein GGX14DRAFT_416902 [Mycena pura]
MKPTTTALLTTAAIGCLARKATGPADLNDCRVQAWVRAQDLSPDAISHGDLRIKVAPLCADQIASVTLRLQLDEFSEVKYLRRGAVLPEIRTADNQTKPEVSDFWGFEPVAENQVLYDYSAYDKAMSDPDRWVVKAEERMAWATEVTLFDNNPDLSHPRVTPFIVVSPAVNHPPAVHNYRSWSVAQPIMQHSFSHLGYHYTAVVKFTDGRSTDIPAGHTNFVPTYSVPSSETPFTWNATFESRERDNSDLPAIKKRLADRERCLPEALRSVFIADVTLEEGNVLQRGESARAIYLHQGAKDMFSGQAVKGKVTIRATNGSTTMSDISVSLKTVKNNHWAAEQATTSGDKQFYTTYERWSFDEVISVDSESPVFKEEGQSNYISNRRSPSKGLITASKPYFDFKLQVPENIVPDFSSYYGSAQVALNLELGVVYSRDVADCIEGIDRINNTYTPVGKRRATTWSRMLHLTATVPLVVLGDISARPVEHYLNPGVRSPAIFASQKDVVLPLPPSHPVIVEESFANTSSRLLRSDGTFDPIQSHRAFFANPFGRNGGAGKNISDPYARYLTGSYAGLLWRKKVIALERGILPAEKSELQNQDDSQYQFAVAP